jgi:hypothetical protein
VEIFVPDYEWNAHYGSVEEAVTAGCEFDELKDGDEFKLVRLTVGACTTYRMVDGKAVPVAVAFPDALPSNTNSGTDPVA